MKKLTSLQVSGLLYVWILVVFLFHHFLSADLARILYLVPILGIFYILLNRLVNFKKQPFRVLFILSALFLIYMGSVEVVGSLVVAHFCNFSMSIQGTHAIVFMTSTYAMTMYFFIMLQKRLSSHP